MVNRGQDTPSVPSRRDVLKLLGVAICGQVLSACTSSRPQGAPARLVSWNSFVACSGPIRATIEQIIGTNENRCSPPGAAVPDWADMSNYQPPPYWNGTVPGDFRTNYGNVSDSDKNCNECPCTGVHGRPIFVQIDGVVLSQPDLADDGDTTFDVRTLGSAGNPFMHQIHCEISQQWKESHKLPTAAMPTYDASEMTRYVGEQVDVQGLVFADLSKVTADGGICSGHSNSVWEIHPVTAWRPHQA